METVYREIRPPDIYLYTWVEREMRYTALMTRIAINGFGRIGRGFVRGMHPSTALGASGREGLELVAVNDLTSLESLAYLLKYDTVYGRAPFEVASGEGKLIIDGKDIPVTAEKDPTKLPWKDLGVDIVVESTGFFTDAQ